MVADQSLSFFDPANPANRKSLLPEQLGTAQGPTPTGLSSGTGLLLPDQDFSTRISNFPEDLYDLSDHSHLVRFLRVLLGDAGAGQLRKRQTVSRLASALTSTHFFDLDRFYGAIFGALRVQDELIGDDPRLNPATPDEWDDIHAADAKFREKIIQMAKAIELGATRSGLTSLAEAVLGAPVQIYEDWQLLDPLGRNDVGPDDPGDPSGERSWAQLEVAYPHYSGMDNQQWGNISIPASITTVGTQWQNIDSSYGPGYFNLQAHTYASLENMPAPAGEVPVIPYGDRFGFHVVPLKKYDNPDDAVNLTAKSADVFQLQRVLRRLKPAGAFMSVDPQGIEVVNAVTVANLAAFSSFWEILFTVTPKQANAALYPVSNAQAEAGVVATESHTPPVYAWQGSQATEWTYNGDVVGVVAYVEDETQTVVSTTNYEIVTYLDGTQVSYTADKGLMDSATAWGAINARAASANPYVNSKVAL